MPDAYVKALRLEMHSGSRGWLRGIRHAFSFEMEGTTSRPNKKWSVAAAIGAALIASIILWFGIGAIIRALI